MTQSPMQLVGKKILIIEDDIFLGDVLLQKLAKEGYKASLARDGKEGFERISKLMPDLVLLDIVLPSMNGYEILEAKKKDPAIAHIPVIVVSNSGQPVEIDRIEKLGVKNYLIKAQFEVAEVLEKVCSELTGNATGNAGDNNDAEKTPKQSLLKGIDIVWVEDDKFLTDILTRKMDQQGATLFHAKNGTEALEYLKTHVPHIIVLDVLLPEMDGFEVLQKIKAMQNLRTVPVMMLSNLGQTGDIEKSKMLGAEKFLVKAAVTLDEIMRQIKEVSKK